jgi:O-antigen ligase
MTKIKAKVDKILIYGMISFGLFPVLPDIIKALLVVFLFLASFFSFIIKPHNQLNYKSFLINSSLYIVSVISLLYTLDINKGLRFMTETRLSGLVFPLIFLMLSNRREVFNNTVLNKLKKIFLDSTFVFCIIFLGFLLYKLITDTPPFYVHKADFFRNTLIDLPLIGNDPIYTSVYLGVAIIFLFSFFKKKKKESALKTLSYLTIYLLVLILLSSKMAIISLLILGFVALNYKLKIKKTYKVFIFFFFIIISFSIIQLSPNLKYRFNELFQESTYKEFNRKKSTSLRISIYKCGYGIVKENFFFGVGVGDVPEALSSCYKTISFYLVENKFNSHNQFLSILLGTGIIGFAFFIIFLVFNLIKSNNINDSTLFYLLIFYILNFLSENLLERQNGIILFYFLICFFGEWATVNKTIRCKTT